MKVQMLVGSYPHMIGLARYTVSLCQAMDEAGIANSLAQPAQPWFVSAGELSSVLGEGHDSYVISN